MSETKELNPYRKLAQRLDALPNGFPPAADGAELRVLEYLFSPEEAALAAELRLSLETPQQIADRLAAGGAPSDPQALQALLKAMARKGLINAGRSPEGLGYALMPFVVGIYEAQVGRIDAELARRFEAYYLQAFPEALRVQPAIHRVLPVEESVRVDLAIQPFESASEIVNQAQAWGVIDCICRTQKALIGQACQHPLDVCMILSPRPGVFDNSPVIRALSREESLATLRRAAQAGLVHSVSNTREGISYICNCCTCSCGVLRGMSERGISNVVARSPFLNTVDEALCIGCENCKQVCQFEALSLDSLGLMQVNALRCVGCGVCITVCEQDAMRLQRRPPEEIISIPATEHDWRSQRAQARGLDLDLVL